MAWDLLRWICFVRLRRGGLALPLKVVDHVGDSCEAVYAAQFAVDAFMAEPIAHWGARFNCWESDMLCDEFVSHAGECMRTLHVHERRRGKIEHHELWQFRRSADTVQDRIANIVHVKVDEGRFGPENHYIRNQFVV